MATVDKYLAALLKNNGTDLHLTVGLPPTLRVDKQMVAFNVPAHSTDEMQSILAQICSEELWAEFQQKRDSDFVYQLASGERFHCNLFFDFNGVGAIFHRIPSEIPTFSDLQLPKVLESICQYQEGLIFVTGPSGSGKSTTLAAMVDYINENYARFILSLESPIEFIYTNRRSIIAQREIGTHCDTLEEALRNAMRSSPDIILISDELEDPACIRLALTCASMGTLVLCSAHTSNAGKALERLITMFPVDERVQIELMLAKTLVAVVAQILCDRADGQGKVPAHEIVMRCETLSNIVRQGEILNLRNYINDEIEGMQSFDACLRQMLAENQVSPPEAYMHATDKAEFAKYLPERTYFGADGSAASAVAEEEDNRPT